MQRQRTVFGMQMNLCSHVSAVLVQSCSWCVDRGCSMPGFTWTVWIEVHMHVGSDCVVRTWHSARN
jgi:hypothetical protein